MFRILFLYLLLYPQSWKHFRVHRKEYRLRRSVFRIVRPKYIDEKNSLKSGLDTFKADSGIKDIGLTVPVLYSPWDHWSIMGVAAYKRLLDDAEDSPVVDDEGDKNQFVAGALLVYRF